MKDLLMTALIILVALYGYVLGQAFPVSGYKGKNQDKTNSDSSE